jgi:virginiamycin B lyase
MPRSGAQPAGRVGSSGWVLLGVLLGLTLAWPSASAAKSPVMRDFPVAYASPLSLTVGADGNLWFTGLGGAVQRMTLSGHIRVYRIPHANDYARGGIATGADGALWFDEEAGQRFGRLTVSGHLTEIKIPRVHRARASWFVGPVQGPDGYIWFAAVRDRGGTVGRIDLRGRVKQWSLGPVVPTAIVSGPARRLSLAGYHWNSGARFSGYVTIRGKRKLSRSATLWEPLTVGPDENLWTLLEHGARRVTIDGRQTFFPSPRGDLATTPLDVAPGPRGDLWFLREAEAHGGPYDTEFGTISARGRVSTYPIRGGNAVLQDIVVGPDGNIWIAQWSPSVITRVTPLYAGAVPASLVRTRPIRDVGSQLRIPLRCQGMRGTFCSGSIVLRAEHHRLIKPRLFTIAAHARLVLRPAISRRAAGRLAEARGRATLRLKTCASRRGCMVVNRHVHIES